MNEMENEKKSCDKQSAFGRQIDEMLQAIPFYRWWKWERKTQGLDPLPIADEAWNVSEKQARLAILTELEREIPKILEGIDKDELEDSGGWWETSTGAEFGKSILDDILALIRSKKGGD